MTKISFHKIGKEELSITTYSDGVKFWKNKKGQTHNVGGPAIIRPNGSKGWYYEGKLHRLDGPAYIDDLGTEIWYYKGKLHRKNGPALIYHNGMKEWWYKNKRHREDGPARIYPDGRIQWWWRGIPYVSFIEWLDKIKKQNSEKYVLTKLALYDTYKNQ